MKRAVMQALLVSPFKPLSIVVDAMPLNLSFSGYQDIPIHHFPKGESLSVSIAAASILAKIKRDELISRYDRVIPGYAFAEHKGYATVAHRKAVQETGRSVIHRMSFLGKILAPKGDRDEQSTLI
jgi:ribonuclease HII